MKRYVAALCMLLTVVQSAMAQLEDSAAVPEPGTVLLLGAGLAGLGYAAWRRNRKK